VESSSAEGSYRRASQRNALAETETDQYRIARQL
jgi:hypothetical protein